jgi:hypothetical protein
VTPKLATEPFLKLWEQEVIALLLAGPSRNFQIFDPLDFLVEVTQHIFHLAGEVGIRRLGNAAARADKADVFHHITLHLEEQLELIAAERVLALRRAGGRRQLMKIRRLLAVVQNGLLVKVVCVVERGWNLAATSCRVTSKLCRRAT